MADIEISSRKNGRRAGTPKIDLTPMVDLGFLLITFFMISTALAKPRSIELLMPNNTEPNTSPQVIPEESTVNLLLSGRHEVYYYHGAYAPEKEMKKIGLAEVRLLLAKLSSEAATLPATYSKEAHRAHVLIKPTDQCTYNDLVNVLDEMTIGNIPYYTIADVTDEEKSKMNSTPINAK